MAACPAHIDIPNFIRRVEAGNFNGAARAIRESNPMAEICGFICNPEHFCEKICYRKNFSDKAVSIQELHKWVASHTNANGWPNYYSPINEKNVAIIGAGPAGLTCGYFLARLGYRLDYYEKEEKPGGRLLEFVERNMIIDSIVQKELSFMISSQMNFNFKWELKEKDQLAGMAKNYDYIYLTAPCDLKLEDLSNSIVSSGRWYSDYPQAYTIIESVRDGRQAAMRIHNSF
jgi:NADH-quinone oxidoreductase subunit F